MKDHGVQLPEDIDQEDMISIIEKEYDCKFTSDFNKWDEAVWYFFSESTVDGYEVFISTHDMRNYNIMENVYYYVNDLYSDLKQVIQESCNNGDPENYIYFSDPDYYQDYIFQDTIAELYIEYWNNKAQEAENELIERGYEPNKDEVFEWH